MELNQIIDILPCTLVWFLIITCNALYFACASSFVIRYSPAIFICQIILCLYIFANLYLTSRVNPGIHPKATNDEINPGFGRSEFIGIVIREQGMRLKWCKICKFYKQPRTSHCITCNRCIEGFDHHCPWVNNCIGKRNYRLFFYLLVSISLHIIGMVAISLFYIISYRQFYFSVSWIVLLILILIASPIGFLVIGLTGFHFYLIQMGRTTNEQVTGKLKSIKNPYDYGFRENCKFVFCTSSNLSFNKKGTKKKNNVDDLFNIIISKNNLEDFRQDSLQGEKIDSLQDKNQISITTEKQNIINSHSFDIPIGSSAFQLVNSLPSELFPIRDSFTLDKTNSQGIYSSSTNLSPQHFISSTFKDFKYAPRTSSIASMKTAMSFSNNNLVNIFDNKVFDNEMFYSIDESSFHEITKDKIIVKNISIKEHDEFSQHTITNSGYHLENHFVKRVPYILRKSLDDFCINYNSEKNIENVSNEYCYRVHNFTVPIISTSK